MQNRKINRLNKEMQLLLKEKEQFTLRLDPADDSVWRVDFVAPKGSVYENEKYTFVDQTSVQIRTELREFSSQ